MITVGQLMNRELVTAPGTMSAVDAAKLMSRRKIGSVLVEHDRHIVGIVTESDIVRKVVGTDQEPSHYPIATIMSAPVIGIDERRPITEAADLMQQHGTRHLMVCQAPWSESFLSGIFSARSPPMTFNILRKVPGKLYLPADHSAWIRLRDLDLIEIWTWGIKGVLSLMIVTLLAALTGGVVKTLLGLWMLADHQAEIVLRQVIIDMLMLLALVEVFKTTVTYFSEGRVKVTFIVDTILVVMLTEVISQWFKGGDWQALSALGCMLLILGIVRVMVVRWSPTQMRQSAYSYMAHTNEGGRT
jgi:uncharacterized membrane protein (DUF373 family)